MIKLPLSNLIQDFKDKHERGLQGIDNNNLRLLLGIDISTMIYTEIVTKSVIITVIDLRSRIGLKELDPVNMIVMEYIVSRLVKLNYLYTLVEIDNKHADLFQGWCDFVWMVITTEEPDHYLDEHFEKFIESSDNWEGHLYLSSKT